MTEDIDKIFRRQFERCKGELMAINCPKAYIDCFSKFMYFANEDINELTGNMENDYEKSNI